MTSTRHTTEDGFSVATGRRPPRGMALLIVLLLLSLTLGLSYAAMRSQSTAGMIQRNADRRTAARQAAITGLTMAMKKMRRNDWAGVDTSLNGSLNASDSFLVTYTTGDPSISATDADLPYRVTLLSTGYSADPNQPQSIAIYRVRAVMHLIPRRLADEPTDWQTVLNYTVTQWTPGYFSMEVPVQIQGPVRVQTYFGLKLDWAYNWCNQTWTSDICNAYHSGLEGMRQANYGDFRPITGKIDYATTYYTLYDGLSSLKQRMNITTTAVAAHPVAGLTFPSTLSTYRLYTGGKSYTIPQLPATIQGTTCQADPVTNPAGLFFRIGNVTINANTAVRGTIITAGNSGSRIYLSGQGISLAPVNLPALQGTSEAVQLPAAIAGDSLQIWASSNVSITGLVAAANTFEVVGDAYANMALAHQGKLVAQHINFDGCTDWYKTETWWNDKYYDVFHGFLAQQNLSNGIKYFPEWLRQKQGLDYHPRLTIKPDPNPVRYHWCNPQNTIYIADPADGGLCWDLLSWTENL